MSIHVVIIGGGIGGLCLAQGLRQAGVGVSVHERDRTRTDRLQGYRIHISPIGSRALRECLPPELFDAFVGTTGKAGDQFTFLTEQLRPLLRAGAEDFGPVSGDPADSHHSVSRITLRQVLLAGLEDVVRFDKKFVKYDQRPDGTITAFFEDGSEAVGDVLIAADGGASRVRRQHLPQAQRVHTGILGIAGKLPLTSQTRALLPDPVRSGVAMVAGARGGKAMFLATQEFDHDRITSSGDRRLPYGIGGDDAAAQEHPGFLFDNTSDYLMWGFAAPRERYPDPGQLESMGGAELRQTALQMIADWHPQLRRLVAESDPAATSLLEIQTAAPVAPWPSTSITLLGDAIHSMTPFRGIGANIALRDAQLLSRQLIAADRGEAPLLEAIGAYESEMITYGFAAVRDSLTAARQATSDGALSRIAGRAFLRIANSLPPLKRRMFADD